MGLTKAQKLERQQMKEAAEREAAWNWLVALDEADRPVPMKQAQKYDEYIEGWSVNARIQHGRGIEKQWQNNLYSYWHDPRGQPSKARQGSQGRGPLYATEAEACLALAYAMRDELAAKIARIRATTES